MIVQTIYFFSSPEVRISLLSLPYPKNCKKSIFIAISELWWFLEFKSTETHPDCIFTIPLSI